ncbi:MAG: BLUF domain-containing protein [Mucilaginibacter sp.]|uniref:BLUF domain-containing protein n=1 Tax=Mucilaginibacter sp. TaxID=1882438 RepID=UPI0032660AE7
MNYLIYISTSLRLLSDHDLEEMLEQSLIHNSNAGITGVLLYNRGTFFQVLEGEEEQVSATFEKIKDDPRHHNIIKMKSGPIAERNFTDWSMGFKASSKYLSQRPGYVDPAKTDFLYRYNSNHPAVYLLKSFATTNNFVF